jgi:hypothetical protein
MSAGSIEITTTIDQPSREQHDGGFSGGGGQPPRVEAVEGAVPGIGGGDPSAAIEPE